METEAQGGGDLSNGSLGILKTQGIVSHLSLVKTKLLEQFLSHAAVDTGG